MSNVTLAFVAGVIVGVVWLIVAVVVGSMIGKRIQRMRKAEWQRLHG